MWPTASGLGRARRVAGEACAWRGVAGLLAAGLLSGAVGAGRAEAPAADRLRVMIETDAGGDPDDEQSLVRFLLYACAWDIEGIVANRPSARPGENLNPVRTGLGIVQAQLAAYAHCYPNLVQHDPRYPKPEFLQARTVAGYADTDAGVRLVTDAVDRADPRPLWFCNWGTDHGSAPSNLRRALDRVRSERGPEGYASFKRRVFLSSYDAFGEHTTNLAPPFPLWVDTFHPPLDGQRWYHRFAALTARAGGFDAARDLLGGHGPLGALYPTNTGPPQKEGDSMSFLYLVPTGMNDPEEPGWGSWGGRYGLDPAFPGRRYYWASQADAWEGATNRDNTLRRWAADLQNDFRARLDWCVKPPGQANHAPDAVLEGLSHPGVLHRECSPGQVVQANAEGTRDPDNDPLKYDWFVYREAGTYGGEVAWSASGPRARVTVPADAAGTTIHLVLRVADAGTPPLAAYRRLVLQVRNRP